MVEKKSKDPFSQREISVDVLPLSKIDTAIEVLIEAFEQDPMVRFVLPNERHRTKVLPDMMGTVLRLGLDIGKVYTTSGMEGISVCFPPGVGTLDPIPLLRAGILSLVWKMGVPSTIRLFSLLTTLENIQKKEFPESHWYLAVLGTRPSEQRKGYGQALIGDLQQKASRDNAGIYLETMKPENIEYYKSRGFNQKDTVSERSFNGALLPIFPFVWRGY